MKAITRENITYTTEEVPKTLTAYKKWEFTSGPIIDEDFRVFSRLFKKYISNNLPTGSALVSFSRGHYAVSGFIQRQGKYVYFSISDVRHFPGDWYDNILVRTAKSDSDYTGGSNCSTKLETFTQDVDRLLK